MNISIKKKSKIKISNRQNCLAVRKRRMRLKRVGHFPNWNFSAPTLFHSAFCFGLYHLIRWKCLEWIYFYKYIILYNQPKTFPYTKQTDSFCWPWNQISLLFQLTLAERRARRTRKLRSTSSTSPSPATTCSKNRRRQSSRFDTACFY